MNDLKILYEHYKGDFPVHNDLQLFIIEHVHYRKRLQNDFLKEDLKQMTFAQINVWLYKVNMFPLISKLVKLVSVIPSSTATCERNFSGMGHIKNKVRNALGDDFLNDLMLGYLEKDLVNKVLSDENLRERVVDVFKNLGEGSDTDRKSRKNYI